MFRPKAVCFFAFLNVMPELPEVETIRRQLERAIVGRKIVGLEIRYQKPLKTPVAEFRRAVLGAKITSIGRRAKLLLWNLSSGCTIMFHLKMTGRILIVKDSAPPTKHTHLVFDISGKEKIFFEDYRKFGFIKLFKTAELPKFFETQGYGPEPLDPKFTFKKFTMRLRGKPKSSTFSRNIKPEEVFVKPFIVHGPANADRSIPEGAGRKIKPLLMEQTCIAGIGNIYAAEACFYARIMPTRTVKSLSDEDLRRLFGAIKKVLKSSIKYRGTSADAYLDAYGKKGEFVPRLAVYGRAGEKCRRCGGTIKNMRLGGRGTDYCLSCQK